MSAVIACPKCEKKYKLPENMLGKPIKCKECGAAFKTPAPVPAAVGAETSGPVRQQASAADLQRFGLDGPVRRQPDVFAGTTPMRGPDVLGNHAADPGFADVGFEKEVVENSSAPSGMEAIVQNPYLPKTKKTEDEGDSPTPGMKKKRRRRKKMHPAVKESLDKASMTMFVIGTLLAGLFGFLYLTAEQDAAALAANVEAGLEDEQLADAVGESYSAGMKTFSLIGIGLGVVFAGLGVGVQFLPLNSTIAALLLCFGLDLMMTLSSPFLIIDMWAWIIRVVVYGALGKAFMDALNARYFEKAQRARRKR